MSHNAYVYKDYTKQHTSAKWEEKKIRRTSEISLCTQGKTWEAPGVLNLFSVGFEIPANDNINPCLVSFPAE